MAKYLMFNLPHRGNVHPTLAIGQELAARGNVVVYYLAEEFRPVIEMTGVDFRGYASSLPDIHGTTLENPVDLVKQDAIAVLALHLVDECRSLIPQVLADVRDELPDAILYGPLAVWGRIIAHILHIPAIFVHPGYSVDETSFPFDAASMAYLTAQMAQSCQFVDELCADYNVAPFDMQSSFLHEESLIIRCLPDFFRGDGLPDRNSDRFVGPCILPRQEPGFFPLHEIRQKLTLYISLGTLYNNHPEFYNLCFQAFARSSWQVIQAIGSQVSPDRLEPAPKNFFVYPYVPQLDVLERTNVFISHGGINSTMEALYYGVPLVVVPRSPEQMAIARRIVELGLGLALDPDLLDVHTLREAVAQVMSNPVYHMNAQKMQKVVQKSGGSKVAADTITDFVSTSSMSIQYS
jgi:MGT family glycosyltransferase